jgi:hypothetical protein
VPVKQQPVGRAGDQRAAGELDFPAGPGARIYREEGTQRGVRDDECVAVRSGLDPVEVEDPEDGAGRPGQRQGLRRAQEPSAAIGILYSTGLTESVKYAPPLVTITSLMNTVPAGPKAKSASGAPDRVSYT